MSAPRSTSNARSVMSRKLPSGVATTYNAGSNRVCWSVMQRHSGFWLCALPLLYFGLCTLANVPARAQQNETTPANAGPHIAILLPVKSAAVGRQADAVRLGVLEAAKVHRGTTLPLIVYATSDESFDVMEAYEKAMRNGAQLVIGPLTRSAVTSLAATQLVAVPTLALNAPDADSLL